MSSVIAASLPNVAQSSMQVVTSLDTQAQVVWPFSSTWKARTIAMAAPSEEVVPASQLTPEKGDADALLDSVQSKDISKFWTT